MKTASIAGAAAVGIPLAAIVMLLAACTSMPSPTDIMSVDGCLTEMRRELRHSGPPGKYPPTPVNREVQVCRPAGAGSAEISASR